MRRILITLAIILGSVLTLQPEIAFADNKIHSIDISIELLEDGSAVVKETRHMTADEGTELYIEMSNLQDSEVKDFSVEGFTYQPDWDSDDSLEEKEGYYGIIQDGDDSELVWGMGEHGDKTYHLTYTLTNAVRNLADGQGLLWNFDTFLNIPTDDLKLTITSPIGLTQDNTNFWAYGFDGDIQMRGDQIVWVSEESLDSSNDVTVLLQFPPNLFNASANVDMTLEEQLEMANKGSSYNQSDSSNTWLPFVIIGAIAIPGLGVGGGLYAYYSKLRKLKREHHALDVSKDRLLRNHNQPSRDVPEYGDDIANISYLLNQLYAGNFEDYFAAYLIKWLGEERIEIETFTQRKFFGENYTTYIRIKDFDAVKREQSLSFNDWLDNPPKDSTMEDGMWLMLLDAADSQGEIDSIVMSEWGKEHANDVTEFELLFKEHSMKYLADNGYVNFITEKIWGRPVVIDQPTPAGDALFDHIIQHVAYIEKVEVDHIDESELSTNHILIWALIAGSASEVNKQFEAILPMNKAYDDTATYYDTPHYWYSTMHFRRNWSTGLSSGGFNSTVVGDSSGGSGGSTSSGGGGGAGGGGGGGAR